MRFENAPCRYAKDDVIVRAFDILGLPPPIDGQVRRCAETLSRMPDVLLEQNTHPNELRQQRAYVQRLLEFLDAPVVEPTEVQIQDKKSAFLSLNIVSVTRRVAVELHAGIGAMYHRGTRSKEVDSLYSEVAPITGAGMDMRRAYLISVMEVARDALEMTFS